MDIAIRSVQLQIAPSPDRTEPEVCSVPQARVLAMKGLNTIHNLDKSNRHYWDLDFVGHWTEEDGSIGWHILGTQKAFGKGIGFPWETTTYKCIICGNEGLREDEVFCSGCIDDRFDSSINVCLKCGADTVAPIDYRDAGKDDLCDKCAKEAGVVWTTAAGSMLPDWKRISNET